MKKEKIQQLKNLFWDWVFDEYADECMNRDAFIHFGENNSEEILEKFGDLVF